MTITASLSFSKIDSLDSMRITELATLLDKHPFDPARGFGFRDIRVVQDYLSAVLIRQTPVFISQLNLETGQFDDHKIFLYSNITFGIDYQASILDVIGALTNAAKVRSVLRQVMDRGTNISASPVSLSDFIQKLDKSVAKIEVDGLTVNNFRHRQGMIGKYILRTIEPSLVNDIVEVYATDVTRASMSVVTSPAGQFSLDISRSGSFKVIYEEDEQVGKIILFLKHVIYS